VKGLISHATAIFISGGYWIALVEGDLTSLIYVLGVCVATSIVSGPPLWFGLHLIFEKFKTSLIEQVIAGYMLINIYYVIESYLKGFLNPYNLIIFFALSVPTFSITFYIIWLMITWHFMPIGEEG